MMSQDPLTTLDARYSSEGAQATPWPDTRAELEKAGLFWVVTVKADGRPHVTPVVGVWVDDAFYFSSGAGEQKSRNLAASPHCSVITGGNAWNAGFDTVLHGDAVVTRDLPLLRTVADAFAAKYGDDWAFEVNEDGTFGGHGVALVYRVTPAQALGFGKGEPSFSHTSYRF
jgi:hypothetical protein